MQWSRCLGLICAVLLFAKLPACSSDTADPPAKPAADGGKDASVYTSDNDAGKTDPRRVDAAVPQEVISPSDACRRYVAYYCGRLLSCGLTSLQYAYACYDSAALCPDLFWSDGATRTVDNVVACGKAWLDHPCEEVRHERGPQCGATLGTRAAGERCVTTTQCKSTRCTGSLASMTCGVCIDQAASGGSCGTNIVCPRDESCVDGTCKPRALITAGEPSIMFAPGQACAFSYDDNFGGCAYGMGCFAKSGVGAETCNHLPGPGERCYTAHDGVCWGEGFCDGRSCAPVYACTNTLRTCQKDQVCVCADTACKSTACAPLRQEGERCMPPVVPCAERLECVENVCKPKRLPSRFGEICK